MISRRRSALPAVGLCALALAAAAGCGRQGGPFQVSQGEFPVPDAGTPPPVAITTPAVCTPAQSSQMIPARSSLTNASGSDAGVQSDVELTSDLYNLFKAVCGGCHVESNLGSFVVTSATFPTLVNQSVLDIITSDNPAVYMPPATGGGIPFSQRAPDDVVRQLATLLGEWIAAGSPSGSFPLPTQASAANAGYAVSPAMSTQLTNIGSCIPSTSMIGTNASAMDALDAMFAQATALPPTLDQTDLVTLDSAALAKSGVISYAPTYPLWSDNAQKMRYIRVPKGKSVVFDKATQTLQIPANTRFYKTFLKQVKDVSGNMTYRKIETRVIVSRPDTNNADGTALQNALFGTYVWNQDESQASLLADPLRDGKPFADRIFTYVTDEQKAQAVAATNPSNLDAALNAVVPKITRHYALPGSERCMQCHMGSPSQSFILGFTPLQVARRPDNEGGIYEAATGDELTQLQRLIDYGVITGMTSPADILPLEQSEGTRAPRNQYELQAQAYMVGNCAHCHNPRGFPSVKQPELKDVLVFLPGPGNNQGIFQFPLDTMSPIRKRGLNQNVPIPYITPSLYDMPSDAALPKSFCPDQGASSGACPDTNADPQWVLAPWRSLIYRNTDTPYDYFDDYAPFPHMPLNTSGYDCRVAQIMGDWMVSIPARVKDPSKFQNVLPIAGEFPSYANDDPQPYEEAFPGDSDYQAVLGATTSRLNQYHNIGFRYGFCPNTYTDDIVDPFIEAQIEENVPVTSDTGLGFKDPNDPSRMIMPPDLTPIRPHYVSFDDTDPPPPWFPRRPDWATALVNPDVPTFIQNATSSDNLNPQQVEDLTNVMNALATNGPGGITLTADVRSALTQQIPFGLWDTSDPSCNFSGVPTAGSFTGAARPVWMTVAPPPANAPVFVETPGAAVFTTVCFNCHGIQADSKGLLSDEITNLTGGDARVANLRDGLLGPTATPGMNRTATFGAAATTLGITTDDLTARYMAWMTLGGTEKHLPQDVLTEVSQSPVVGQVRAHIDLQGTPDMLRLGLSLCEQVGDSDPSGSLKQFRLSKFVATGRMGWSDFSGLVDSNGDAEMWLKLCNLGNRPFVRVPSLDGGVWTATTSPADLFITPMSLYWAQDPTGKDWYGANPVMDQNGNVATGVDTTTNLFPICVLKPTDPTQLGYATQALQAIKVNGQNGMNAIPFCPDGFVQTSHQLQVIGAVGAGAPDFVDGRKWAARGAINAALAVFLYLDEIERDPTKRQPLYTQCSLLQPMSTSP
jgi:mono/diheme cytochrome c family protein